jgi:hypothetical protein
MMLDGQKALCRGCGRPFDLHLLDAKPDDPQNPDSCDWNRLECGGCYRPGYVTAASNGPDFCTLAGHPHEPLIPRCAARDEQTGGGR